MSGTARVTQIALEALDVVSSTPRVDQIALQSANVVGSIPRVDQVVLQVLCFTIPEVMVAIYPTLVGLGFSVIKRPKFNTNIGTHVSGREVRIAMWGNPMWEWELTYDFLSDGNAAFPTYANDLKTLLGFYLSQQGPLFTFLFLDPDDHQVVGSQIGIADGSTTVFVVSRTFGAGSDVASEPVGQVDTTKTFNVYVNGTLQSTSAYALSITNLVANTITFASAPAANAVITVDCNFYYAVRFKDDQNDFEKFMSQLWSVKKITLMSTRA